MNFAIIISEKDIAGMNIKEKLVDLGVESSGNAELHVIKDDTIFHEGIDKEIDADMFIFATRHAAVSGKPTLCVHTQGNFSDDNSYGGEKKKLCIAPACYLKEAMKKLNELNDIGFDICQEATHHGPYLEKPSMFIEIGSTENEWKNEKAGRIIAKVIMHLCEDVEECSSAICVGGIHYMLNFSKVILNSDVAIGHCCPKYNLENLDKEMLQQMIDKTVPKPKLAIFDWKGVGSEKQRLISICEELGLEVKKTKEY